MIQKRFDELQPYLKGVKFVDGYSIVECSLKGTWTVKEFLPEGVDSQSGKQTKEGSASYIDYVLWGAITIDELVSLLENIINTNIEIEQKQALLKHKVEELKKMFQDKSLEELKNLSFTAPKIKPEIPPTQVIKEGENPNTNVTT